MNKDLKDIMNEIEVPKELKDRSTKGIQEAEREWGKTQRSRPNSKVVWSIGLAAAAVLLIFASVEFFSPEENKRTGEGIDIPALELPEQPEADSSSMVSLIVYKGNIYTQSDTTIDREDIRALQGEKLGETIPSIDEWSDQSDYAEEFASTISQASVYSVEGYEESFRIMTLSEENEHVDGMLFEKLNGLTVTRGEDVFGKLKIEGNIKAVQYRSFEGWDSKTDTFQTLENEAAVQSFITGLYNAVPVERTSENDPIGTMRSDETFKELVLNLKDGTEISLILLSDKYVYYGTMPVYFEMTDEAFSGLWNQLEIN
ncbi:hypothetical protein SAMN04488102_10781 [Alkalibacterium subtropicum]|uniref:Uncharacterized protein n=1 Tax=Alkalibacterium subtropicum TaxID=753702 RepID=A0A1I1JEF0_9LACT|nr:hypothetical protein [Alkalibacterium subtropicum]SFC46521.1 hypothetical protein SAMN04488102_10781 [Alkalibacterium subtropicum]